MIMKVFKLQHILYLLQILRKVIHIYLYACTHNSKCIPFCIFGCKIVLIGLFTDDAIQNLILEAPWFKSCKGLCAYISCSALREVDTSKVLRHILNNPTKGMFHCTYIYIHSLFSFLYSVSKETSHGRWVILI